MTIDEYNMSEFSVVISCRMRNPEVHIKWLHVVLHARFSLSRSHAADIKNLHPIHTPTHEHCGHPQYQLILAKVHCLHPYIWNSLTVDVELYALSQQLNGI